MVVEAGSVRIMEAALVKAKALKAMLASGLPSKVWKTKHGGPSGFHVLAAVSPQNRWRGHDIFSHWVEVGPVEAVIGELLLPKTASNIILSPGNSSAYALFAASLASLHQDIPWEASSNLRAQEKIVATDPVDSE